MDARFTFLVSLYGALFNQPPSPLVRPLSVPNPEFHFPAIIAPQKKKKTRSRGFLDTVV